MEGQKVVGREGYGGEMTLYICWGGFLEECPGGSYITRREERLCVSEGKHGCA